MLCVRNLSCGYGSRAVLDHVSFTAPRGQVTVVLGVNGSGKTTLLRCLAGLKRHEGLVELATGPRPKWGDERSDGLAGEGEPAVCAVADGESVGCGPSDGAHVGDGHCASGASAGGASSADPFVSQASGEGSSVCDPVFAGSPAGRPSSPRGGGCAYNVSFLQQDTSCSADLLAFEVVLLGRLASLRLRVSDDDLACAQATMERLGIVDLAERRIGQLSGGQRQLVFIAQALAKRPDVLVMDEPTSALDLRRRFVLLDLLRSVTAEMGCVTVATLHHLDLAARYADQLLVLDAAGRVHAHGAPDEVYVEDMVRQVYGVSCERFTDADGRRHLVALSACARGD
ncbi:ABC transporter ATP-binding protein [Eggerthellaceae bacterium zg-997]|nr:ABC transporter ATP-binding protein [Eggerthellaceae bacterium zg-997]